MGCQFPPRVLGELQMPPRSCRGCRQENVPWAGAQGGHRLQAGSGGLTRVWAGRSAGRGWSCQMPGEAWQRVLPQGGAEVGQWGQGAGVLQGALGVPLLASVPL